MSFEILSLIRFDIEGNPFIIRFKTNSHTAHISIFPRYIEGNPFIIRFKTFISERFIKVFI